MQRKFVRLFCIWDGAYSGKKEARRMKAFYEKNRQMIHNLLLLLAAILLCFLFFRYLFSIFLPFLLGWLLSLLFSPLADRLERCHVPRGIGALLGILLFFAALGLLGFWSGTSILDRARHFSENLPLYLEWAETKLGEFWAQFDAFRAQLPAKLQELFVQFQNQFSNSLLSILKAGGASHMPSVSNFFLSFFVMLISAYFFTKDRALVQAAYQTHIAPLFGISLHMTKQELKACVWGYIKTQLILMGFIFVVTLIGMLLLRSPHAFLLSMLIAVIDSLPFFGSGFILWPGAAIQFAMGNTFLAVGYLALYGVIQILRQILQPKILGTQIGLHPLLTLFSMYFGFRCIGVWGLILGPMIAVILKAFFRIRKTPSTQ